MDENVARGAQPRISIPLFLRVDGEGRLRPEIEVAYYTSDTERFVYVGSIDEPEKLQLDRQETYNDPNAQHGSEPWSGRKHFAQKGPGANALAWVRQYARGNIDSARERGELLGLALRIAAKQRDEAAAWAEARVRYLVTLDPETVRKYSGSVLSSVHMACESADPAYERWNRLLTFNVSIRALGREFAPLSETARESNEAYMYGGRPR